MVSVRGFIKSLESLRKENEDKILKKKCVPLNRVQLSQFFLLNHFKILISIISSSSIKESKKLKSKCEISTSFVKTTIKYFTITFQCFQRITT